MKTTLKKIAKKARFVSSLAKKAAFQKITTGPTGTSYLTEKEKALKRLIDQTAIEKSETEKYFTELGDRLYNYLVSSGISYKDICQIIAGKMTYTRSGFTPDKVQQVLVDNYCKTNGIFQEAFFDFLYRDHDQKLIVEGDSPLFGKVDIELVDKFSTEIRDNGYVVLPFKVPQSIVSSIVDWSKDIDYSIIDDSLNGNFFKSKINFDETKYTKALASEDDLKSNKDVMRICTDPLLLSILQTVLKSKVDLWNLTMWWSFKTDKPSDVAAQYFHYDLDSLRWLKIFVYLTDVGPENGPHTAIPGTHQLGGKNYDLLKKRYNRISDREMEQKQAGEITEFYGPAGTIIIADTRCWHKGKEVLKDRRLILQPTFSPTYFIKKLI